MTRHKVFIANGVFPRFTSTPARYRDFGARAKDIADEVKDSGADCATFGELGQRECAKLAEHLPFQYDRAQGRGLGTGLEGLNSVWSSPKVWDQPEDRLVDRNLPSGGEWQRTLLLARLILKGGDPADEFFTLGAFHETLGQAAGYSYVKAMVKAVGGKRVLLGGDFKRTGDRDDLAYMRSNGFAVHERSAATPMVCFTKGSVPVSDVDHRRNTRLFDHDFLVVSFSIPDRKVAP